MLVPLLVNLEWHNVDVPTWEIAEGFLAAVVP
jgi:hypothetical protein